ncbi:MAG: HEAT repeat domain-containing protein [Acidobacteria bacterium]|nr:HEAT repeat domain-containing protein [Acidobacteriota bacterium]
MFRRFDGNTSEVAEAHLLTLRRAARRLDEPVVWAGEFSAAASLAFLRPAVLGERGSLSTPSQRARERLLSAIAMHDDLAAVEVVLTALDSSQTKELRESTVFWVSQVGGAEGLQRLLDVARNDTATEVRMQSIFWLGQVAGERATADLANIAEDDPNTEVRQSAVFALSQSEDDAAIEALIGIVRSHDNREVVKSALFWLGQSGDPRAVELFEQLIFGGR